ncbi:hypothetical protein IAT38_007988 [Cryptococcus sp. DSM 104549]
MADSTLDSIASTLQLADITATESTPLLTESMLSEQLKRSKVYTDSTIDEGQEGYDYGRHTKDWDTREAALTLPDRKSHRNTAFSLATQILLLQATPNTSITDPAAFGILSTIRNTLQPQFNREITILYGDAASLLASNAEEQLKWAKGPRERRYGRSPSSKVYTYSNPNRPEVVRKTIADHFARAYQEQILAEARQTRDMSLLDRGRQWVGLEPSDEEVREAGREAMDEALLHGVCVAEWHDGGVEWSVRTSAPGEAGGRERETTVEWETNGNVSIYPHVEQRTLC